MCSPHRGFYIQRSFADLVEVLIWGTQIPVAGETGRCLHTRKKEHIRNTKVFKSGSNVASHAWLTSLYIYIFTFAFYTSLFKDCRLAIESSVFLKFLTRERLFNFSIMPPDYSSIFKYNHIVFDFSWDIFMCTNNELGRSLLVSASINSYFHV